MEDNCHCGNCRSSTNWSSPGKELPQHEVCRSSDAMSPWREAPDFKVCRSFDGILPKKETVQFEEIGISNLKYAELLSLCYKKGELPNDIPSPCGTSQIEHDDELFDNALLPKEISSTTVKERHRSPDTRYYQCADCEYGTKDRRALKDHYTWKHLGMRPFGCTQCDYTAVYKRNLQRHMKIHQGNRKKTRSFRCEECDYSTAQKCQLKRHILQRPSREPFRCPYCSYSSCYSRTLEVHKTSFHVRPSSYQCSNCEYATPNKNDLTKHSKRQHQTMTYRCHLCHFAAHLKDQLVDHYFVYHS